MTWQFQRNRNPDPSANGDTPAATPLNSQLPWRVSEANLHLLELLGGWPAALLAQRRLRHKCSKGSYQFMFWLIVLGHQFAAGDSFQDWKLSRAGMNWLEQHSDRRR